MYGISINRITALNPGAEEVIKIGDTLRIPQNAIVGNPIQSQDAYVYHTVAQGETLYSLSKRYRTTVNEILKENPGITPQTLPVGEVIRIASDNKELTKPQPKPEIFYYKVKGRKETIESIATEFNVTVDEILAVNGGKRQSTTRKYNRHSQKNIKAEVLKRLPSNSKEKKSRRSAL